MFHTGRKLQDTFGDSLKFVNTLYTKEFGHQPRKVPAHMPHMIDTKILKSLQSKYSSLPFPSIPSPSLPSSSLVFPHSLPLSTPSLVFPSFPSLSLLSYPFICLPLCPFPIPLPPTPSPLPLLSSLAPFPYSLLL